MSVNDPAPLDDKEYYPPQEELIPPQPGQPGYCGTWSPPEPYGAVRATPVSDGEEAECP
jgi:hypothetical protein